MKKFAISIDHSKHTISASKSFIKRANIYGTDEYHYLRKAMIDLVGYKVVAKETDKKTYKALTFERMKEYIETQANKDNLLIEFEAVKAIAAAKGSKYPLTKKWFLLTFPQYKVNEVAKDETAAKIDEIKAFLATLEAEEDSNSNTSVVDFATAVNQ